MFISEVGLKFSFLVGSLCGLGNKGYFGSKNVLGTIPSDSILRNSLQSIGIRLSINVRILN